MRDPEIKTWIPAFAGMTKQSKGLAFDVFYNKIATSAQGGLAMTPQGLTKCKK
jgi:hypothetical protein